MLGDFMGKLQEMQQKMEEAKKRLDTISVSGEAQNGDVTVEVSGNRKVKSVNISAQLLSEGDKDQIEDLLLVALNRALEKAESVYETEMKSAGRDILPGDLSNLLGG